MASNLGESLENTKMDAPPHTVSDPAAQGMGGMAEAILDHEQKRSAPSADTNSTRTSNTRMEDDMEKGRVAGGAEAVDETADEEKDPNIVDWDGPTDPTNPKNWTTRHKWSICSMLAFQTFITPLASSMFAPGVPDVMAEFHQPFGLLSTFVVSVYVLGYAVGPLVLSPMSEMYGRLPIYHVTNVLFIIFTVACALSTDLNMLIGFRFLEGCVGSAVVTMGGGTITDLFDQRERGRAMAIWSSGPLMGPVLGPIMGGFLSQAEGWRWVFWVIAIASGCSTITFVIFLRETYTVVLLARKAERLRKETGNQALRSKYDTGLSKIDLFKRSLIRPLKMLVMSPIVAMMSLFMAIIYGYLYLLFTTLTEVFEGNYGFSPGAVGLTYLGIGIGILFGWISDKMLANKSTDGEMKPEYRLPPMIPGAFFIPVGLFIYGWTAEKHVFWFVPILGTGFVGFGILATFMPIQTYLVDAFTLYAASVLAALTVLRSLLGALLPMAGPSLYATLGLGWGNSLLGFIALGLIPVPFFFIKYGERIRKDPRFQVKL